MSKANSTLGKSTVKSAGKSTAKQKSVAQLIAAQRKKTVKKSKVRIALKGNEANDGHKAGPSSVSPA